MVDQQLEVEFNSTVMWMDKNHAVRIHFAAFHLVILQPNGGDPSTRERCGEAEDWLDRQEDSRRARTYSPARRRIDLCTECSRMASAEG